MMSDFEFTINQKTDWRLSSGKTTLSNCVQQMSSFLCNVFSPRVLREFLDEQST